MPKRKKPNVRDFVCILMTAGLVVLTFMGIVPTEYFVSVLMTVIGYFFGAKKSGVNNDENK